MTKGKDRRASPRLEKTLHSEGGGDIDGTKEGSQPTYGYRSKSGSSKAASANKPIPVQVHGGNMQTFVLRHRRLAHASPLVVKKFLQLHYPQIRLPLANIFLFCDICVKMKQTRKTFDKVRTLPTQSGEIISADLIGPISPATSPHGYKFALTVIDGFTKFARVFLLKHKTETLKYLKLFLDQTRAQHPIQGQLKIFRSDNGREFVNRGVQDLLMEYGMEHQVTEPYTSPHNVTAERFNRTIEQKTRSLLSDSGFPTTFWGLAIGAAECIYNRTPHSAIDFQQPIAKWKGQASHTNSLAVFGAVAYHLLPNRPLGKKFHELSKLMFLVGYSVTGYSLYDPDTKKTIESCNVKVDESRVYRDYHQHTVVPLLWDKSTDEVHTSQLQSKQSQTTQSPQQVTVDVHEPPRSAQAIGSQQSDRTSYRSIELSDLLHFQPHGFGKTNCRANSGSGGEHRSATRIKDVDNKGHQ